MYSYTLFPGIREYDFDSSIKGTAFVYVAALWDWLYVCRTPERLAYVYSDLMVEKKTGMYQWRYHTENFRVN